MRKRTSFVLSIACVGAILSACGGGGKSTSPPPPPPPPPTGYRNPVLNQDFPDPTVIKVGSTFWAYATQTFLGNGLRINIQMASSPDLVNWTFKDDALPVKPAWSTQTWNFWAPHVIYAAELTQPKYIMYYSADADTSDMCIGIATSTVPQGPFTDVGSPLICGPGFSHIDPMAYDDPTSGKHYLYWGSAGQPIVVRELDADRVHFAAGSVETVVLRTSGAPYEGLIEGAWVIKRGNFYYLFYSGNDCCSLPNPHYAVLVARSTSPTGTFTKMADALGTTSVILDAGDYFKGPGHNAIISDSNGDDWIVYHAVDLTSPTLSDGRSVRRPMLIDRLRYQTDGWPYVEGGHPSHSFLTPPVVTP